MDCRARRPVEGVHSRWYRVDHFDVLNLTNWSHDTLQGICLPSRRRIDRDRCRDTQSSGTVSCAFRLRHFHNSDKCSIIDVSGNCEVVRRAPRRPVVVTRCTGGARRNNSQWLILDSPILKVPSCCVSFSSSQFCQASRTASASRST